MEDLPQLIVIFLYIGNISYRFIKTDLFSFEKKLQLFVFSILQTTYILILNWGGFFDKL